MTLPGGPGGTERDDAYDDPIAPVPPASAASDDVGEVRLRLPARPGFVQVARLTVTAVVARIGFSYDEIEDLRIAVGETCSLLVAPGSRARLSLRITTTGDRVAIDTSRVPAGPDLDVGELSEQILRAVTDDVEIDRGGARVTVTKQHRD